MMSFGCRTLGHTVSKCRYTVLWHTSKVQGRTSREFCFSLRIFSGLSSSTTRERAPVGSSFSYCLMRHYLEDSLLTGLKHWRHERVAL